MKNLGEYEDEEKYLRDHKEKRLLSNIFLSYIYCIPTDIFLYSIISKISFQSCFIPAEMTMKVKLQPTITYCFSLVWTFYALSKHAKA